MVYIDRLTAYKGNIIFTKDKNGFTEMEHAYIIARQNRVVGVFSHIPEKYAGVEIIDHGESLIIPAFVDMHLHAPQFENMGLGMDRELMPWLETYTFPEEAKFADIEHAKSVYDAFTEELKRCGTAYSSVFATIHKDAAGILAQMMAQKGLKGYVGKVNMDRNSPSALTEHTDASLLQTEQLLDGGFQADGVLPIITPRFVPTCSEKLMGGLSELAKKYDTPVQSHLCENTGEIAFVKELHPNSESYGKLYDDYGLLNEKTIMAHCVHLSDSETALIKERGAFIAHCPTSNTNLLSGIAPVKKYLEMGLNVGLGSDISAGHTMFMPRVIASAIEVSKLSAIYADKEFPPITPSEAFYMATKGGGRFFAPFGKIGSFEEHYTFDAIVIDDRQTRGVNARTLTERLMKFIYNGDKENMRLL